jgi:hypothetical protein
MSAVPDRAGESAGDPGGGPAAAAPFEGRVVLLALAATLALTLALVAGDWGFYWRDDNQGQHVPGSREVFEALRAGELPIFSPRSWIASELGGEYLYGVFSAFTLALDFATWSLRPGVEEAALLLALAPALVLGAGTSLLARSYGVSRPLAILAAPLVAHGGWLVVWGATSWLPAYQSFAFVPWTWWFLRRAAAARRARDVVGGGLSIYLVLAGGWPHTCAMIALVAGALAVEEAASRRGGGRGAWRELRAPLGRLFLCWCIGVALAAPALLLLVDYSQHTLRSTLSWSAFDWRYRVPLGALGALLLPSIEPPWTMIDSTHRHPSFELAGLLLPTVALVCAPREILRRGLRSRALLGVGAAALALMLAPSVGPLRWSFRWLPLFHLALVVAGLRVLTLALRAGAARAMAARGAWAVGAVWGLSVAIGWGRAPTHHLVAAASLLALLGWRWAAGRGPRAVLAAAAAVAVVPLLVVLRVAWPTHEELPTWHEGDELLDPAPFERGRTYLSAFSWNDMFPPPSDGFALRLGNQGMLAGLDFVNGYSSMLKEPLAGMFQFGIHGEMLPVAAAHILTREAGPDGLLALMGVHGIALGDSFASLSGGLEQRGWREVETVPGGRIFHRAGFRDDPPLGPVATAVAVRPGVWLDPRAAPGPPGSGPHVAFAEVGLDSIRRSRSRIEAAVEVGPDAEGMLVARVPWSAGWRASVDGVEVPVESLDYVLPVVRLPASTRGSFTLEYRPRILRRAWIGFAFGVALCALVVGSERRPRRDASRS